MFTRLVDRVRILRLKNFLDPQIPQQPRRLYFSSLRLYPASRPACR